MSVYKRVHVCVCVCVAYTYKHPKESFQVKQKLFV